MGTQWRYAYLIGVVPALLVFWVRSSIEEPPGGSRRKTKTAAWAASVTSLERRGWASRARLRPAAGGGGTETFWGVVVAGQDLAGNCSCGGIDPAAAAQQARFAYGIVQTTGMGLGLLAMGPLSEWLGRRGAFL